MRKDYTGYENDAENGHEFAQARFQNPVHGRFTSVDPLTASATIRNPQSFNRYTYALNSPYKFTDPLGLLSQYSTGACGNGCPNSDGGMSGYDDNYWAFACNGFCPDGVVEQPETQVSLTVLDDVRYPVEGDTAKEAATNAQNGAMTPNGNAAETIFAVAGNVTVDVAKENLKTEVISGNPDAPGPIKIRLSLGKVVVSASIYTIYPDWANAGKAPESEQRQWTEVYLAALKKFEGQHFQDVKARLNQFASELSTLSVTAKGKNMQDVALRLLGPSGGFQKAIQKRMDRFQRQVNGDAKNRHKNDGHRLRL